MMHHKIEPIDYIEGFMIEAALRTLKEHSDYQVLDRIPTELTAKVSTQDKQFIATIIDLETMGLHAKTDQIIELGMLSFSFSNEEGILAIADSYNELNDPGIPIPSEVTKVTGIRDEDVKGKAIDWERARRTLNQSHLIICHNSGFDRNFLELQTPEVISARIQTLPFGCTLKDVNWKERGIESAKLDYINWKLGYFYDGHRAINDCWATLNVLLHAQGAFDELKANVRKKETLLCAVNAPFDKKDLLKERQYRWSDGTGSLPKSWWICVANECLADETRWLEDTIYGAQGASERLPQLEITARNRYSFRAERLL